MACDTKPLPAPAIRADPVRWQPLQDAGSVRIKGIRRRMRSRSMRQTLELASQSQHRVVGLGLRRQIVDAEFWRVGHDLLDRPWATEQRHEASQCIHPRRLRAERRTYGT